MPDLIHTEVPSSIQRSTLDPDIKSFLADTKLTLGGKEPFTDERRHHTQVLANAPVPAHIKSIKVEPLIVPGPVGELYVRCYHPPHKGSTNGPHGALVYIHGGGWTVGSLAEFDIFFRLMAYHGNIQVYGSEYHLAPEWKYPTQLNEVEAVIRWLHASASNRNVDPTRIALGGDSAGGNMTAVLALRASNAHDASLSISECNDPRQTGRSVICEF